MIKFGTDGWRAIISDEFTFDNVARVAQSIATYLLDTDKKKRPVIIGYDARFLADEFAFLCAKILKANGISSWICDRDTPTPVVAWEVIEKKAAGAIMLTASHNPPEYCGLKFITEYGGPAFETVTKKIEEGIKPAAAVNYPGDEMALAEDRQITSKGENFPATIERFRPEEPYLRYISNFVDVDLIRHAKLCVAYDPMFGSGRSYMDKLLEKFGVKVEVIHNYRDVLFGGRNPEPSAENLLELSALVVKNQAQIGLANDGDADRFGIIDEKGQFLNANQVISLLANYLLKEKKLRGNLVRSVATTHMLDAIAAKNNVLCHEVAVGFKHIAKLMLQGNILIGGEESGGLSILGHIPEKDGILAGLLIVEMVAKMKMSLSKIYAGLENEMGVFFQDRMNLHIDAATKARVVSTLKNNPPQTFCGQPVVKVNLLDGIKIVLADGSWFLIRPSGTEPLLRVYLETNHKQKTDEMKCAIEQVIKAA